MDDTVQPRRGRPPKEEAKETGGVIVTFDREAEVKSTYGGDCQNCKNNGKIVELDENSICHECGFDKTKLYGAF
jgi:hypothetical protein